MKICSTIGFERARQELLQLTDEDAFVERDDVRAARRSRRTSRRSWRSTAARCCATASRCTRSHRARSARRSSTARWSSTCRTDLQYDEAHIPDAICISARHQGFGSKLAWVAKPGQSLIFVGRDDDDARVAAELASAVGLRDVAGVLAGGMTSWREEKLPVETVQRMTADELKAAWGEGVQLLDVRERSEWDEGHVRGSIHAPYHDLDAIPDGIDASRPVAVACNSGPRAAVAVGLLKRHGLDDVIHVVDGGVTELLERS